MLFDILCNTEYLIQWMCRKLAKRAVCGCCAKIRQLGYCKHDCKHNGVYL